MTQREKALAILFIRPGAEFVLHGLDIEWHDANKTQPTEEQFAYLVRYLNGNESQRKQALEAVAKYNFTKDQKEILDGLI